MGKYGMCGLVYGAILSVGIICLLNDNFCLLGENPRMIKFCLGLSISGFGLLLGAIADKK